MNVQIHCPHSGNPSATGVQYIPLCCGGSTSGSWTASGDSRAYTEFKTAGVLSNVSTYIENNTTTGTHELRVRKNSANGNGVISFTSETGWLEDTVNTDTVASGDKFNYRYSGGTTITVLDGRCANILWSPTTGTVAPYSGFSDLNGTIVDTYIAIQSSAGGSTSTTEAFHQANIPTSGTLQNLWLNCDANTRTGGVADVWRSRVNGANGNFAITITQGVTAEFEDLSNTDAIVAGDLVNFMWVNGSTSGRANFRGNYIELSTTDCFVNMNTRESGGSAQDCWLPFQSYSTRTYAAFDAEVSAQCRVDVAFTWSDLWAYQSDATSVLTIRSRINGANGNQTISWATEAGEKIDTTNEDAVAIDDLVCYYNDWTSGASATVRILSSLSTAIAAAGGGPRVGGGATAGHRRFRLAA